MFKIFAWILSDRSGKWPKFRSEFLKKNSSCCACGTVKKLTIHHIVPVSIDPSKELDEDNCIALCKTCHFVFGHLHSYNSWNDNVRKDCVEHLNKVRSRPCQKG